jgi:hypothetical protein
MARGLTLLLAALTTLPMAGCVAAHVAGDVAEGAVKTTGAVIGVAADKVTTSDEERAAKADRSR